MVGLVRLALAPPRGHRVSGALGLDAVEQPHRTARRARSDLEFGMQPPSVIPQSIRHALAETSGLPNALGEVFREVANVTTGFLSTAENTLDVHLRPQTDDMGRFCESLAGMFPSRKRPAGVGISEALSTAAAVCDLGRRVVTMETTTV
jgi:hypothetical protein